MTDERAIEWIKDCETVYFINCINLKYFVDSGKVINIEYLPILPIVYKVRSNFTGKKMELYACDIYDNMDEAKKACKEMQREYGKILITQKEYDEYMELKKAYLSLGNWTKITPETMPPEMQLLILTVGNWCDKNKIILPNKARLCCGKFEIYENGKWDRGKLSALRVTHWAYYPKPADD